MHRKIEQHSREHQNKEKAERQKMAAFVEIKAPFPEAKGH
jgi:hypothetical protein